MCDSRNIGNLFWLPHCHPKKKIFIVIQFHHSRQYQFWDYNPKVGLIVAGGDSPQSVNLNISRDNGLTVETLTEIPYGWCSGSYKYISAGCLVIVNETTVFVAGGEVSEYMSGKY